MIETTTQQKMKMCPLCLSDNGEYKELDVAMCEMFGYHHTKGNTWRGGPKDTAPHKIVTAIGIIRVIEKV